MSQAEQHGAKWWLNHGTSTPKLRILASRILNLTCSSSACERNWSVFEQVHTKRRNKLLHDRMRDLVFVKFNSKLRNKRERKSKDPIEKEVDDVVGDDKNEFITGLVLVSDEIGDQNAQSQDGASQPQGGQSSQPTKVQAKRRPLRPRKKKLRSLQALLSDMQPAASSSSESEDGDGDILMRSSDSSSHASESEDD